MNNIERNSNHSNTGSQTEREPGSLPPTPRSMQTLGQKKLWAYRAYHGIGRNGKRAEEKTQREIADTLDVDERTVRRWLNDSPSIDGLSREARFIVFIFAVTGNDPRDYIERVLSDPDHPEPEEEQGMLGLSTDFSPW